MRSAKKNSILYFELKDKKGIIDNEEVCKIARIAGGIDLDINNSEMIRDYALSLPGVECEIKELTIEKCLECGEGVLASMFYSTLTDAARNYEIKPITPKKIGRVRKIA